MVCLSGLRATMFNTIQGCIRYREVASVERFHTGLDPCSCSVLCRNSCQVVIHCILLAVANGQPLRRWELPNWRCRLPTSQRYRCFWYSHVHRDSDFLAHSVARVSILALVVGSFHHYTPRVGMVAAIIIYHLLLYRWLYYFL
jgi:hypothetical protein